MQCLLLCAKKIKNQRAQRELVLKFFDFSTIVIALFTYKIYSLLAVGNRGEIANVVKQKERSQKEKKKIDWFFLYIEVRTIEIVRGVQ